MKSYNPDKLYSVLLDIFGDQYEVRDDQFRIDCINPNCDDDSGNLEISLNKGIFHCWKCEYSGRLFKLLRDYLGKTPDLEEYVSPEDLRRFDISFEAQEEEEIESKEFTLPKEYVPFDGRPLGFVGQKAYRYALKRMSQEDIQKHRVGYCGMGSYKWRIIIPVLKDGKPIYFVGRSFMGNKDLPYKNPDEEECGIGKAEIVFNAEGAIKAGQAIICEGVIDAIKVGDDGVAIFGTHISEAQIRRLQTVRRFYVFLDDDALDKAVTMAQTLRDSKPRKLVHIIIQERGDPDNFTRQEIRDMINEAIPFSLEEEIRLTEIIRWKKPSDFKGFKKA